MKMTKTLRFRILLAWLGNELGGLGIMLHSKGLGASHAAGPMGRAIRWSKIFKKYRPGDLISEEDQVTLKGNGLIKVKE